MGGGKQAGWQVEAARMSRRVGKPRMGLLLDGTKKGAANLHTTSSGRGAKARADPEKAAILGSRWEHSDGGNVACLNLWGKQFSWDVLGEILYASTPLTP